MDAVGSEGWGGGGGGLGGWVTMLGLVGGWRLDDAGEGGS